MSTKNEGRPVGRPNPAEHAATLGAFIDTHEFVGDTDVAAARAALIALAERATELERERDEAREIADGMARAPYGEFEAMRERAERAEAALRSVGEWLATMEGRTVTASDLGVVLPELERAVRREARDG
jgi:hypothetical protein